MSSVEGSTRCLGQVIETRSHITFYTSTFFLVQGFLAAMPTTAMADSWFATKGKLNDEEPATQLEVRSLKDYLAKATSSSTAAKLLMNISEDEKPLDDKLNRIAWLIFDAAIHFQSQQILIIELVEAINNLSPDDLDFTSAQKERFPGWQTWRDFDKFELLLDDMRRSKGKAVSWRNDFVADSHYFSVLRLSTSARRRRR